MSLQPSDELRTGTFLVADLAGYRAGAAAWRRHGDPVAELRREGRGLLEAHRGRELPPVGDDLRVVCRDPSLAVILAVRLVDDLARRRRFPPVRAGVYAAWAGPTDRRGIWTGAAVSPTEVAARLCTAAAGGEVLVGEETLAAATQSRGLAVGPSRLHWLRGVVEPIAARPVTVRP